MRIDSGREGDDMRYVESFTMYLVVVIWYFVLTGIKSRKVSQQDFNDSRIEYEVDAVTISIPPELASNDNDTNLVIISYKEASDFFYPVTET